MGKGKYDLSISGENHIRELCGTGNSKLQGRNSYVLPLCKPACSSEKIWVSNPDINGGIRTNQELADALIKWYNDFSKDFSLYANIVVAQAIIESDGLKVWTYSKTGAMGITQFLGGTLWDVVIQNNYGGHFSDAEMKAISKDVLVPFNRNFLDPFNGGKSIGQKYREQLHQNIIDNPRIMIKAQFVYMNYAADLSNGIASCALFGYNRGPGFIKGTSYTNTIHSASLEPNNYEDEGIKYVYRIFDLLYRKFGYIDLDITKTSATNFNKLGNNYKATLG